MGGYLLVGELELGKAGVCLLSCLIPCNSHAYYPGISRIIRHRSRRLISHRVLYRRALAALVPMMLMRLVHFHKWNPTLTQQLLLGGIFGRHERLHKRILGRHDYHLMVSYVDGHLIGVV